jgi:hypothetical protein
MPNQNKVFYIVYLIRPPQIEDTPVERDGRKVIPSYFENALAYKGRLVELLMNNANVVC